MQGLAVRSFCRAGSDVRPPVLAAVLGLHQRGPFNRPCFAVPEPDEEGPMGSGAPLANGAAAKKRLEERLTAVEVDKNTLSTLGPLKDALISFVRAYLQPIITELIEIRNALGQISEQFAALNDSAATKQQMVEVHKRMDRELQDVDRTIVALERRIETLETPEIPIDPEADAARDSLIELSRTLKAELRGYHETTQRAQEAFREVSGLLQQLTAANAQISADNVALRQRLDAIVSDNDRLRREMADVLRRNEELRSRNAQLDDTIHTMSTRVGQAALDLARAQRKHEEDGLELSRARITMQELINASAALREQVATLRTEVIELRGKVGNH